MAALLVKTAETTAALTVGTTVALTAETTAPTVVAVATAVVRPLLPAVTVAAEVTTMTAAVPPPLLVLPIGTAMCRCAARVRVPPAGPDRPWRGWRRRMARRKGRAMSGRGGIRVMYKLWERGERWGMLV